MKWPARLFRSRTQLSCHQVGRMIQSYLDGELDDDATHRVAAHLEDCRRCGMEADTYNALKSALRRGAPQLVGESVERLRAFGERLARGEIDPEQLEKP